MIYLLFKCAFQINLYKQIYPHPNLTSQNQPKNKLYCPKPTPNIKLDMLPFDCIQSSGNNKKLAANCEDSVVMIANENQQPQQQKEGRISPSILKSNQVKLVKEYSELSVGSQTQVQDSLIDKFYENRLQEIVRRIKVSRNVVTFINKLKRNANIMTKVTREREPGYQLEMSKVYQTTYHIIIVVHYMAIMAMLLITSWTATIIKFNRELSASREVLAVQIICLCAFVLQQASNFGSHFFLKQKTLPFTLENLKQQLFQFNSINIFFKALCSVFFLIFPSSMVVAAIFFVVLVISLFLGITELAHLEAAYIHTEKRSFLWKIRKILGLNILIIHIMATILIAMTHLSDTNNWFIKFQLVDETWYNQYITAFYWSTIIVTTIGFGDISASSPNEKLIVSFLALIACIILAYNITVFSKVFSSLTENYEIVELKVVKFRRMIRRDYRNNVDMDPLLKIRIYNYLYSLSADKRQLEYIQKNEFLSSLPQKLRKDYHKNTNPNLFTSIIFFNSLRNDTLSTLSEKFSMVFLEEGQSLYPDDREIRVLEIGCIDFTYLRMGSTVNGRRCDSLTIGKRENVGLLTPDFLTLEKLSNYGLCASKYSVIWNLTTQNFINVLRNDVMDFEHYFSILHKHNYNPDFWGIVKCPRCYQKRNPIRHTAFKCPKLSYMPFRKVLASKTFFSPEFNVSRSQYFRKKGLAPRTSVLKYWKNFLKNNYELQRKRDEDDHIKNVSPKPKVYFYQMEKNVMRGKRNYNYYYLEKQRDEIINQGKSINFELDSPFNFEFYFPIFNPSRLIFTRIDKYQNANETSIASNMKHIKHIKGQRFSKEDLVR